MGTTGAARSVGELGRKLDEVVQGQAEILHRLDQLDERYVPREVAKLQHAAVEQQFNTVKAQVASLQSWQDWAIRIVLAFVVLGVLGAVVKFGAG